MTDQLKRAPLAARTLVAAACLYEVVALFSPRVPTITQLTHRAKNDARLRVFVWAAAGGAIWHFFVESIVEEELS